MDYQIATEAYAQSVSGRNVSYTSNLGCTKSRAIALGCDVAGTYLNNQLVCQKDLSKAVKTYTYNCNVHYLTSQNKPIFYIIGNNTLVGTQTYIDASTSADYKLYTTSPATMIFYGNKYVNNRGTSDMISGQTYHILYVLIEGSYGPNGKIPPGNMQDNWKSAGSFVFNSTIYEYNNIDLNVQL